MAPANWQVHEQWGKNPFWKSSGYFAAAGVRSPTFPCCFPVRQIKLVKGLQPLEVAEKGTVTFEVEVSHEDVEGTWQKDGVRLKPSPNVSFGVLGKKHSLTLSSVALEDAGLISFKAEGINSSGKLTVTGTRGYSSPAWGGCSCLLLTWRATNFPCHCKGCKARKCFF